MTAIVGCITSDQEAEYRGVVDSFVERLAALPGSPACCCNIGAAGDLHTPLLGGSMEQKVGVGGKDFGVECVAGECMCVDMHNVPSLKFCGETWDCLWRRMLSPCFSEPCRPAGDKANREEGSSQTVGEFKSPDIC
ncbi:hypothetical protein CRENBAI_011836 [Crenichthys baileyi]|uniref:Uncharacterized protein n=1 Tax=Crenichthys baileyi TaxID=28760 RepID=A0AAV9SE40_9TELE